MVSGQHISLPDFEIRATALVSDACREHKISTFYEATGFIHQLPYGRNADKTDLRTLFADGCATCSTKHAFLKQLALEHARDEFQLIMGLFRMNGDNTPAVAKRLQQHQLPYIPEAHCYLKFKGQVFDYTYPGQPDLKFAEALIEETELAPQQITDYKVSYHQNYLKQWLSSETRVNMELPELWTIREQCIRDLSN